MKCYSVFEEQEEDEDEDKDGDMDEDEDEDEEEEGELQRVMYLEGDTPSSTLDLATRPQAGATANIYNLVILL